MTTTQQCWLGMFLSREDKTSLTTQTAATATEVVLLKEARVGSTTDRQWLIEQVTEEEGTD